MTGVARRVVHVVVDDEAIAQLEDDGAIELPVPGAGYNVRVEYEADLESHLEENAPDEAEAEEEEAPTGAFQ